MATFNLGVQLRQKKADGTYNITLRVTHHRKSRWIRTGMFATANDLTKKGKIKSEALIRRCRDLHEACIDACNALGYAAEGMEVDEIVERVKDVLLGGDHFRLDFFEYADQCAAKMKPGTGSLYITACNALKRCIKSDRLDIGQMNSALIREFIDFLQVEPSQRGANRGVGKRSGAEGKGNRALSLYVSRIKTLYNRAKEEFNDEDTGTIRIKGNPFKGIRIETPPPTAKRAISAEDIQRIIDLPPFDNQIAQIARDCFLLSFALIGMNSADMYACAPAKKGIIVYNRQKTASRRADGAEMHVAIDGRIEPLLAKYSDKTARRLLHFYLRYGDRCAFNKALNKGLNTVGAAIGIPDLTFYAARHSWATIARTPVAEPGSSEIGGAGIDKYVVHEALNHVDPAMKVTDIYLVKNWQIIFDANRKVLDLFDWKNVK